MKVLILFSLLYWPLLSRTQSISNVATPHESALVDLVSTNKGVLIPRMESAQRMGISTPAPGLIVFDLTTNSFWYRNANSWVELADSINTIVHRKDEETLYMGLTDPVGVGTMEPEAKLQVMTATAQDGISHTNGNIDVVTTVSASIGGSTGTKSNHAFALFAGNGVDQFKLLQNGNVGIGTAMPSFKLQVTGLALFDGNLAIHSTPLNRLDIQDAVARSGIHATARPLYVTGAIGANENGIEFRHSNGSQGIGFGYNTMYATGSNENQDLGLEAKGSNGYLLFKTNNNDLFNIQPNGRVGIGTFASAQLLDVWGNARITGKVGIGISNPNGLLQFSNTLSNKKLLLYEGAPGDHQFIGIGVQPNELRYQTTSTFPHLFNAATSDSTINELMHIKPNGHVGMGVSPDNRLDIASGYRSGSHPAGLPLYVTGDMYHDSLGVEIRKSDGTQGIGFGYNTIYAAGSNASQDINIAAVGNNGNILFKTNEEERMRIRGNGNVKITNTLHAGLVIVEEVHAPGYIGYQVRTCSCPEGTSIIGGGYRFHTDVFSIRENVQHFPFSGPPQWFVSVYQWSGAGVFSVYAICARIQ